MGGHITTDKKSYVSPEDVIVTAWLDNWDPSIQIKIVIWDQHGNAVVYKYFDKPPSGKAVWDVSFDYFVPPRDCTRYSAQLEVANIHVHKYFKYSLFKNSMC